MDERLKEKLEQSNKQIKDAKEYAKMYQNAFKIQANQDIKKINEETSRKKAEIKKNGEETMKKLDEISGEIKAGNIETLLKDGNIL